MNKIKVIVTMLTAILLSSCVKSYQMAESRNTDNALSCDDVTLRMGELNAIKALTLAEKNSKNAVAGLLFFSAISGNQTNTQTTINAVNKRKKILSNIYQTNHCVAAIPFFSNEKIKEMISKNQVKELQP